MVESMGVEGELAVLVRLASVDECSQRWHSTRLRRRGGPGSVDAILSRRMVRGGAASQAELQAVTVITDGDRGTTRSSFRC